jgi:hypothetical protein
VYQGAEAPIAVRYSPLCFSPEIANRPSLVTMDLFEWALQAAENSRDARFVTGHDFSRGNKAFVSDDPSRLQPTAEDWQGLFS